MLAERKKKFNANKNRRFKNYLNYLKKLRKLEKNLNMEDYNDLINIF